MKLVDFLTTLTISLIKPTTHCHADMPCYQIQVFVHTLETHSSVKHR